MRPRNTSRGGELWQELGVRNRCVGVAHDAVRRDELARLRANSPDFATIASRQLDPLHPDAVLTTDSISWCRLGADRLRPDEVVSVVDASV